MKVRDKKTKTNKTVSQTKAKKIVLKVKMVMKPILTKRNHKIHENGKALMAAKESLKMYISNLKVLRTDFKITIIAGAISKLLPIQISWSIQ